MNDHKPDLDVDRIVNHWIEASNQDFETMLNLYDSRSYGWSLFIGHIVIEKLLKALYVKRFSKHAPFTHNLFRLAELAELKPNSEYSDWLDVITSFNINARYDDHKREFYGLCNAEYAGYWIERIKTIRSWIKEML